MNLPLLPEDANLLSRKSVVCCRSSTQIGNNCQMVIAICFWLKDNTEGAGKAMKIDGSIRPRIKETRVLVRSSKSMKKAAGSVDDTVGEVERWTTR